MPTVAATARVGLGGLFVCIAAAFVALALH
jgi:hypothetical protein